MSVKQNENAIPTNSGNPALTWIHCNRCFEILINKRKKFGLLTCQHIFCETCLQKCTENNKKKCLICKKEVNVMEINNEMETKFRRFFQPQPWTNLANFTDVIPFQMKHRNLFLSQLQKPIAYNEKLIKRNEELRVKCKKLQIQQKRIRAIRYEWEEKVNIVKKQRATKIAKRRHSHGASLPHRSNSGSLFNETGFKFDDKPDTLSQGYHSKSSQSVPDFSFY